MSLEIDVKYGINIVYNPTGFEIVGGCAGIEYIIKPFSTTVIKDGVEVEGIFDPWHVKHLLDTKGAEGLVSLEYGKKARAKYAKFEDYKTAQEIKGLQACYRYQTGLIKAQEAALKQMKEAGASVDASFSKISEKIERRIDAVEKWLKSAGATITQIEEQEPILDRPEWREKEKPKKEEK